MDYVDKCYTRDGGSCTNKTYNDDDESYKIK